MKLSKLFSVRVIIMFLFIFISLLAIKPTFNTEGVAIRSVDTNSSAAFAGISVPLNAQPTNYERILEINGNKITSLEDYSSSIETDESKLTITTNKGTYTLLNENIGLVVDKPASNNIIKGLELQGGTRALIQPSEKITEQQFQDLIDTMANRLDVYGIKQLIIKRASDIEGNKYIIIEIAGATKSEVQELIGKQGKFEAKIGDKIVFEGGNKDVTFVCRNDGTCSGIRTCDQVQNGYQCQFEFQIKLSKEAAQKQADATKTLDVNVSEGGYQYLEQPLDLYLDNNLVDSLNIAADLKGKAAKDIVISGPGVGPTQEEALKDANNNMKKLQTILITGALPTSLNIVKMDSISPSLGSTFEKNALTAALLAILAIAVVIFVRYRKLKLSLPIVFISLSEALITLGILTLMKYNLDLAAIAGIIAAVGTGVDDQVVITDEILSKESVNWKERYKKAFFVIMTAYLTAIASMIPLLMAGVGLLKGFAIATIIGVTIGVFVTRPAYANIIKVLLNE
jgi:preprotein translocase subunit SecD